MAIPRIGQEVIVDYLDGDCDQPIVTGRTYRATNRPPYALPDHKILSTIKSKEYKGSWPTSCASTTPRRRSVRR